MAEGQGHSRDDLWQRINDQTSQIGEVRSGQAATDARLGALESAVEQGFRALSTEIAGLGDRVNKPDPPPNYLGIIVLAIGVLGMFGGYALLITGPMRENIEKNYGQITELESHRQRTASVEAQVGILETEVRELRTWQIKSAYDHGRSEEIGKRVEDIDTYGSRRWVDLEKD